ncbi:MAG: hypothetical protein ACQPRJ_06360 [Solitalea-like symbiont of Acarus siro]
MNNLLRITLLGFFLSLGLFSCGKDSTPVKDKEQAKEDGSMNNDMPGGGKYVDVELVSAEPDWSNVKVGETITLKFKVISHLDESQGQYSRMHLDQEVDKGSATGNMNAEVSMGPESASNVEKTTLGSINTIVSQKASTDPVYMLITIKPNYTLPATIKIATGILDEANNTKHIGRVFTYRFTPKN